MNKIAGMGSRCRFKMNGQKLAGKVKSMKAMPTPGETKVVLELYELKIDTALPVEHWCQTGREFTVMREDIIRWLALGKEEPEATVEPEVKAA